MRQDSAFEPGDVFLGSQLLNRTGYGIENQGFLDKLFARMAHILDSMPRQVLIGLLLVISLLAFEIFNFDTTQYALGNLLGDVNFMSLRWATILAVAFCAIDFAGLAYLFNSDSKQPNHQEVWYLMGAWLLGATMNALMTWWAVSVTLLGHELGNEVLSREDLLLMVPIFVAVLVWLTRILFIGAFTMAGNRLFGTNWKTQDEQSRSATILVSQKTQEANDSIDPFRGRDVPLTTDEVPGFLNRMAPAATSRHAQSPQAQMNIGSGSPPKAQTGQRPPRPSFKQVRPAPVMSARSRRR